MTDRKAEPESGRKPTGHAALAGRIWKVLSNILAVSSIASLSDQLVVWIGFIDDLIEFYRLVRDWLMAIPFDWVDMAFLNLFQLEAPFWLYDYLTLGTVLLVSPMFRALVTVGTKLVENDAANDSSAKKSKTYSLGQKIATLTERGMLALRKAKHRQISRFARSEALFRHAFFELLARVALFVHHLTRATILVIVLVLLLATPLAVWLGWPLLFAGFVRNVWSMDANKRLMAVSYLKNAALAPLIFCSVLILNVLIMRFLGVPVWK